MGEISAEMFAGGTVEVSGPGTQDTGLAASCGGGTARSPGPRPVYQQVSATARPSR